MSYFADPANTGKPIVYSHNGISQTTSLPSEFMPRKPSIQLAYNVLRRRVAFVVAGSVGRSRTRRQCCMNVRYNVKLAS